MRRSLPSLVFLLVLGGAGCGSDTDTAGSALPAPRPASPSPAAEPSPTPAQPGPGEAAPRGGSAEAGAASYASFCASCHGSTGESDGPLGESLSPRPARHADGGYMNSLSDEYLFKIVKLGGSAAGKSPLMAPWGGVLDDQQIRDVVAFLRTLARPAYQAP